MITADQIAVHLFGDYCAQSDWMAQNKTKSWFPAACHALTYSLPFWMFQPTLRVWLVILGTHYLIDRYRLARYVAWAKNFLAPKAWWGLSVDGWKLIDEDIAKLWRAAKSGVQHPNGPFSDTGMVGFMIGQAYTEIKYARTLPFSVCSATGYPPSTPPWLSVWLMIILDNLIHIAVNGAAIKYL